MIDYRDGGRIFLDFLSPRNRRPSASTDRRQIGTAGPTFRDRERERCSGWTKKLTDGTEDLSSLLRQEIDGDDRPWTIGELAKEYGVTLRAMRFYEAKGLLRPSREGTSRFYDGENRWRLRIILRAKRVGFSLVEIRELLALAIGREPIAGRLAVLRDRLVRQTDQLHERRAEIETALRAIGEEIAALDHQTGTA